jgi:hypothetical protein
LTNHINNITAKENNSLRIIKRNFKTSKKLPIKICKAQVRILFHGLASLAKIYGLQTRQKYETALLCRVFAFDLVKKLKYNHGCILHVIKIRGITEWPYC